MSKRLDIEGLRFGKLVAREFVPGEGRTRGQWLCECDCGNTKVTDANKLISGNTSSCGCNHYSIKDASGERYGKLTVLSLDHQRERGQAYFKCQCDCGVTCVIAGYALRNGTTSSCGCLRRERTVDKNTSHGLSDTKLYRVWSSMKQRCRNPNATGYEQYGGRGIDYHDDFETFEGFYAVMGEGYQEGLELERINNDGPYAPGNLRWATRQEQMNNTRSNTVHVIAGEVKRSTAAIAREYGLEPSVLRNRLTRGCDIEEAVQRPFGVRPERKYDFDKDIGQRFGRLVIESFSRKDKNHQKYYHCRCDCGAAKEVRLSSLRYGSTTSCGCVQREAVSNESKGKSWVLRDRSLEEIRRIKADIHSMSAEDIAAWYDIPEHTVQSIIDGRIYADLDY